MENVIQKEKELKHAQRASEKKTKTKTKTTSKQAGCRRKKQKTAVDSTQRN